MAARLERRRTSNDVQLSECRCQSFCSSLPGFGAVANIENFVYLYRVGFGFGVLLLKIICFFLIRFHSLFEKCFFHRATLKAMSEI